jgi:hypothetical protein
MIESTACRDGTIFRTMPSLSGIPVEAVERPPQDVSHLGRPEYPKLSGNAREAIPRPLSACGSHRKLSWTMNTRHKEALPG